MSNGDQGPDVTPNIPTFIVEVNDIKCPDFPTEIPFQTLDPFFRDLFCQFNKGWKLGRWVSELLAGSLVTVAAGVMVVGKLAIVIANPFITGLSQVIFTALDTLRKELDQSFALLASSVLNELLGTDFTVSHLASGTDINAHLARAEEIGLLFHRQILGEFLTATGIGLNPGAGTFQEPTGPTSAGEKITPLSGVRAAARFTGLAINFATANGIIATLAGLVPQIHLDEIREIGEEVARNLGLGRLQRLALAPLVQILLAEPYKWFINETARPTQFGLGEVVNPFSGAVMPPELIWRDLARAGYSDDKIDAVLELHRKKQNEADLLTLFEGAQLDYQGLLTGLKRLGYADPDRVAKAEADHLRAQRPFYDELRAAAVGAYADGHIDETELQSVVDSLPLSTEEKSIIIAAAKYKRKVPSKHLTIAEIQSAFELGFFDLADFTAQLTALGYSDDDQSILLILTLDKLNRIKEKEAAAAARNAAKGAKKSGAPGVSPIPPSLPAP